MQQAKAAEAYEEQGIIKPSCEEIRLVRSETIYYNEESGLCTRHYEFATDRGVSWDKAADKLRKEVGT